MDRTCSDCLHFDKRESYCDAQARKVDKGWVTCKFFIPFNEPLEFDKE